MQKALGWKLSDPDKGDQFPVLIGLGSNIDPDYNLPEALRLLARYTHVVRFSSIWQTKAVGSSGPDYLNAAALVKTDLPLEIFRKDVLSRIERKLGRVRSDDKYMDRTIDLDVLVFKGNQIDTELWTQAHIAVPASEVLPRITNQQTGETLLQASRRLKATAVIKERPDLN